MLQTLSTWRNHAAPWGRAVYNGYRTLQARTYATQENDEPSASASSPPTTHFKITLQRSAISLGDRKKRTLESLGLHRRMQTVYHRQTPAVAGKILFVKELVGVENVPAELVRTKQQQRQYRKGVRGYKVTGKKPMVEW